MSDEKRTTASESQKHIVAKTTDRGSLDDPKMLSSGLCEQCKERPRIEYHYLCWQCYSAEIDEEESAGLYG